MAASAMDDLAERFGNRGVSSAFIYAREAHPGEHYRHHTSMADKRANAAALKKHCGLRRPILLDDLDGTAHRAYGCLPNMTWIIGPSSRILYKATWTEVEDVEDALEGSLQSLERRGEKKLLPFYSERLAWRHRDDEGFRQGLKRSGPQAVSDFFGVGSRTTD